MSNRNRERGQQEKGKSKGVPVEATPAEPIETNGHGNVTAGGEVSAPGPAPLALGLHVKMTRSGGWTLSSWITGEAACAARRDWVHATAPRQLAVAVYQHEGKWGVQVAPPGERWVSTKVEWKPFTDLAEALIRADIALGAAATGKEAFVLSANGRDTVGIHTVGPTGIPYAVEITSWAEVR